MNINIAISSYKDFYGTTLKELIPSLIVSGVFRNNIYVFVGGYDKYELLDNDYDVNMYKVPHNSFDFTSLVSIVELDLNYDYWFSMHDTCKVGPAFYEKLKKLSKPNDIMKLTDESKSMNIGIYSNKFINNNSLKILNYKNTSDDVNTFKSKLVKDEDVFIKDAKPLCKSSVKKQTAKDYYSTGIERVVEYYSDLDFYKMKSNWKRKPTYEIKL
jgi:hypothetical protein